MKKFIIVLFIVISLIIGFSFYFINYNNKTEQKCIIKKYNLKGELLDYYESVIINKDTILNGKFINYNEKGIKISEGQFLNNEPYGNCIFYDKNGIIEKKYFRKNSKIDLECTYYNKNGILNRYIACNENDIPFYVIQYDKIGVTRSSGLLQVELFQHELDKHLYNKDEFVKYIQKKKEYKVGDKIKCRFIYPNIPNAKKSYSIEIENSSKKFKLNNIKYSKPFFYDIEEKIQYKGKNTILSIVKYEFNDKVTPVFIDTLKFDIYAN
ncbi:hypothetical protein C3B47_13795 [Flavobacterium columnare]|uniref:hypothetical protein n=1 Tax=Flavobacterium TaxID=237 RepID=UPI0007C1A414|nr:MULTISPECIES: hypothetical protein [Flavobacterium]AND64165.1 hypothetical protein AX766_06940 [Flavobacterium covae]ANO47208.1 hypothetical protein Pf1_01751 [Flavobacterium columnare]APT22120.1 hypothetical protein BU993_05415 [Flavobacterium columnare]MBF6653933.1 hypothetical protein [Flavobacterium columnare]PTD14297.1 hypothetical protein C6N29_07540 [Flavobacterium columnare]